MLLSIIFASFYGGLALCTALFAFNMSRIFVWAWQDALAGRARTQASRQWLALGLPPRTVEEVAILEGRSVVAWTSDSAESFLAPYTPQPGDLDGLAKAVQVLCSLPAHATIDS